MPGSAKSFSSIGQSSGSDESGSGGPCSPIGYGYRGRAEAYVDFSLRNATSSSGSLTGSGFVWSNIWRSPMAIASLYPSASASLVDKLYRSNLTPAQNALLATYDAQEANFSGYAATSRTFGQFAAGTVDANSWGYTRCGALPNYVFQHNGGPVANNVYGYYLIHGNTSYDGIYLGDFSNGGVTPAVDPVPMICDGDTIDPTPLATLDDTQTIAIGPTGLTRSGNLLITDQCELAMLAGILRGSTYVITAGLLRAAPADIEINPTAAERANFSGYAYDNSFIGSSGVAAPNAPALDGGKASVTNNYTASFTHSGGATANDIVGYYLRWRANFVDYTLGYELFNEGPITLATAGDSISFDGTFWLWDANQ